jgi:hypothetical protein
MGTRKGQVAFVLPYLTIYFDSFERRGNLTGFDTRSQTYDIQWVAIIIRGPEQMC